MVHPIEEAVVVADIEVHQEHHTLHTVAAAWAAVPSPSPFPFDLHIPFEVAAAAGNIHLPWDIVDILVAASSTHPWIHPCLVDHTLPNFPIDFRPRREHLGRHS